MSSRINASRLLVAMLCFGCFTSLAMGQRPKNEVKIKKAVFAKRLGDQKEPIDPTNSFSPDETIYLSVSLRGRPSRGVISCKFFWGKQEIAAANYDLAEINRGVIISVGESTNVGFHLSHKKPLPISERYRAEVLLDSQRIGSYPFRVTPPADAIPTKLTKTVLAGDVDDDFNPLDSREEFAPRQSVYLVVHADVGEQSWVQAEWYVGGKLDPNGTRSLTFQDDAKDTGFAFSFVPENGWPLGEHEVVITVDDDEAVRRKFTVRQPPAEKPKPPAVAKQAKPENAASKQPLGDPQTAEQFNRRGEAHYEDGRYEEALADFNRALKMKADFAEAMSNRAWTFYQLDDPRTALADFAEAVRIDRTLVEAYRGRAEIFTAREKYAEAIDEYTDAIRNCSDTKDLATLYNDRGDGHFQLGQWKEALADFERAIKRNPNDAWHHANRAVTLQELGRGKEAVEALKTAIEKDPQDADLRDMLGWACESIDDYDSAIAAYSAAIDNDRENPDFYLSRGAAYRHVKQFAKAEKDLRKAVELAPDDSNFVNELGILYFEKGNFAEAAAQYTKAIRLDNESPIFWFNRGEALAKQGEYKKAIADLTVAIQRDPKDADAYALRGRSYQQVGDAKAATADYTNALRLAPEEYRIYRSKFVRLANKTGEPLTVFLQYRFPNEDDQYEWLPAGADSGKGVKFEFAPDEAALVYHGRTQIRANRVHIWARGIQSENRYEEFANKDLVLVADGSGYVANEREVVTLSITAADITSTGSPHDPLQPPARPRRVAINTLNFFGGPGNAGGVCAPVEITVEKNPKRLLQVGFIENRVDSYGGMWRAAGWMATVMAADLVGFNPLTTQVTFSMNRKVDGPSAGGLMTIGVIAALRGDEIRPDAAMTGTINPDGTIGPVGGIAHKIDGAAEAGMKLVLIPYGIARGLDVNQNKMVDLVERGRKHGIEVKAVGDVYTAYQLLTGQELPRAQPAAAPKFSGKVEKRLIEKVEETVDKFQKFEAMYNETPLDYRNEITAEMFRDAQTAATRCTERMSRNEVPAAYQRAWEAAMQASIAAEIDRTVWVDQVRGRETAIRFAKTRGEVEKKMQQAIDGLKQYEPKTVSAVGLLLHGYSKLVEAMACRAVADALLSGEFRFDSGGTQAEQETAAVLLAAAYVQLAALDCENIMHVLEVAGDVTGRAMPDDAPLDVATIFYRRSAAANLNQFEKTVVADRAEAEGVRVETMKKSMMQKYQFYLLTQFASEKAMPELSKKIGDGPALRYAMLGGALFTYVNSSRLMAELYSLGVRHDDNGNPSSIASEVPLDFMLDFGEDQARRNIQLLVENDVDPMATTFFYQMGAVLRNGELDDKIGALVSLWQANVQSRTLAYLGGIVPKPPADHTTE